MSRPHLIELLKNSPRNLQPNRQRGKNSPFFRPLLHQGWQGQFWVVLRMYEITLWWQKIQKFLGELAILEKFGEHQI